MSEVTSQRASTRGRGVSRGGRGGGAIGRGGRYSGASRSNGDTFDDVPLEEQGELGQLKLKYASQLLILKEMFPTWTDEDLINPLEESLGDAQQAASLITEGHATQWSDVKKKAKDPRPKSKAPAGSNADDGSRGSGRGGFRGGRGGAEAARGTGRGRGGLERGSTRGRGGHTARGAATNNEATETGDEKPKEDTDSPADVSTEPTGWASAVKKSIIDPVASLAEKAKSVTPAAPMTAAEKPAAKSSVPAEPPKKTWASMFHKPTPPPPAPAAVAPKKTEPSVKPKVEASPPPPPAAEPEPVAPTAASPLQEPAVSLPPPVAAPTIKKSPIITPALPEIATPRLSHPEPVEPVISVSEEPAAPEEVPELEPPAAMSKLTEENLEKIENVAPAPPTSTAASTVATTPIPSSIGSFPPKTYSPMHRVPGSRSGLRRILDQQEAVVMPGKNSLGETTVQFGSLGLMNGDLDDSEEVDIPEKPETVTQPPQQSPIGQPKTSLPAPVSTAASNIANIGPQTTSVSQVSAPQEQVQPQPVSVPRHAPGLAAPIQQPSHANPLSSSPSAAQHIPQQAASQPLSQSLPRQQGFGGDQSKFDSFGQQQQQSQATGQQNPVGQSPYAGYQSQSQQSQHGLGGNDPYGNFYSGGGDPTRNSAFNTLYNTPYGQQNQSQQQGQHQPSEQGASQARSSSALGGGVGTSLENTQSGSGPASSQQGQQQSRFGSSFQGSEGSQPSQGSGQQGQGPQHPNQYPMHPSYYPYYNYISMYGHYNGYPKGFYGASPQGYMSPGGYEHSSSPAGYGGFGGPNSQGRESSLNEFGRSGSSQAHHQQQTQHSNVGYGAGGMPDYMSPRQQSQLGGLGSQQQLGLGGQQGGHSDDTLKPYGESKAPSGPSGGATGAPGRPPSTSGLSGQGGQSQLAQGQSQHQQQNPMGGSGYPHHLQGQSQQQQHNPLMGGGVGNQGGHHNSGYGMYGGFGSYPQYGSQGGNRQQQGGGWGYGGH